MSRFRSFRFGVSIVLIAALAALPIKTYALGENEIRTYMPFTFPVDPAKIHTIPDLSIAYALTSTLLERDNEKEISAGLAEAWIAISPKVYRFTLKSDAKWSDGTPIVAVEVKKSLERTLKVNPEEMRGVLQVLETIECPSPKEIDLKLKVPAHGSKILERLADRKFSIVKINPNGEPDLSITTGLFSLLPSSNHDELILVRNRTSSFDTGSTLVDRILIRKLPKREESPTALFVDKWPNFIESTSLSQPELSKKYQAARFETWGTPLDKAFYMQLSKQSANSEGRALIRFLRSKIRTEDIVQGMSGYALTSQLFPRGYELYDSAFLCSVNAQETLPDTYNIRPIEILISPARVSTMMKRNLSRAIKRATGIEPHFNSVPLEDIYAHRILGDFDLYVGVIGLAEPDPETLLSFFIEGDIPLIFTKGTHLLDQLDHAKSQKENGNKLKEFRSLLRDAQCNGNILPFFHLSTIGIGRPELDFSQMSASDESLRFTKIRFKKYSTNANEKIVRGKQ